MGVVMTTNNPHGLFPDYSKKYFDLVDALRDTFGNQWIQPTPVCKCNEQGDTISSLLERIATLENTVAELRTRIEWMENYDKEINDDTADDSSL